MDIHRPVFNTFRDSEFPDGFIQDVRSYMDAIDPEQQHSCLLDLVLALEEPISSQVGRNPHKQQAQSDSHAFWLCMAVLGDAEVREGSSGAHTIACAFNKLRNSGHDTMLNHVVPLKGGLALLASRLSPLKQGLRERLLENYTKTVLDHEVSQSDLNRGLPSEIGQLVDLKFFNRTVKALGSLQQSSVDSLMQALSLETFLDPESNFTRIIPEAVLLKDYYQEAQRRDVCDTGSGEQHFVLPLVRAWPCELARLALLKGHPLEHVLSSTQRFCNDLLVTFNLKDSRGLQLPQGAPADPTILRALMVAIFLPFPEALSALGAKESEILNQETMIPSYSLSEYIDLNICAYSDLVDVLQACPFAKTNEEICRIGLEHPQVLNGILERIDDFTPCFENVLTGAPYGVVAMTYRCMQELLQSYLTSKLPSIARPINEELIRRLSLPDNLPDPSWPDRMIYKEFLEGLTPVRYEGYDQHMCDHLIAKGFFDSKRIEFCRIAPSAVRDYGKQMPRDAKVKLSAQSFSL